MALRKFKNLRVFCARRKRLANQCHLVSHVLEHLRDLIGDIVVEQELHSSPSAICSATRRSIAAR